MPWLKLKASWPGPFRRVVRSNGQIIETLTFSPGEPLEVPLREDYLRAISDSLGHALIPLEIDERGKFVPLAEPLDIEAIIADLKNNPASESAAGVPTEPPSAEVAVPAPKKTRVRSPRITPPSDPVPEATVVEQPNAAPVDAPINTGLPPIGDLLGEQPATSSDE